MARVVEMTVPELCDDIIVEILSWLPVRSLMRFKSVNKSFKSFINDPKFVKLHLQRSRRETDVILNYRKSFRDSLGTYIACPVSSLMKNSSSFFMEGLGHRFKPERCNIVYVSSCNGLVCFCVAVCSKEVNSCERYWIYLWNPATGQTSKILMPLAKFHNRYDVYDGSSFGFGYDNLHDTYKVVAVKISTVSLSSTRVYRTSDNCWTNIEKFPACPSDGGVYLSGTLNWLAFISPCASEQRLIVSLDLGNETYTQFSLPVDFGTTNVYFNQIKVLRGCLCFCYTSRYGSTCYFVMWQMKEFGVQNSWTQLLNIIYPGFYFGKSAFDCPVSIGMDENGDVLMFVHCTIEGETILYNRTNNAVHRIEVSRNVHILSVTEYVQSLVSPYSMSAKR